MDQKQNGFSELEESLSHGGADAVLSTLSDRLRNNKRFHELFETLKMQVRRSLGLPLLYSDSGEELEPAKRDALEEGLIEACRTVGTLLLDQGLIREGWTYLRPVGEKAAVRERIQSMEVTEGNVDQIIEVCLHDSVDLQKGFELLLANYGTCNSITTFESAMYGRPRSDRAIGATLIVQHVHAELLENVIGHIEREENAKPESKSIAELLSGREWLTADGSYHIDVTHLSAAVRIARDVNDQSALRQAFDLTQYGRKLDAQLQYAGDEPFADPYESHGLYFSALLNDQTDEALDYFRSKAESCSPHEETTAAIEVYIDLLYRLGRTQEAIDAFVGMIPTGMQTTGLAPSLLELCEAADNYDAIRDQCRQNGDELGYAMGLLKASANRP